MSKPVLFLTGLGKDLKRAENMNALVEAYPGDKKYMSMRDDWIGAILSKEYDLYRQNYCGCSFSADRAQGER